MDGPTPRRSRMATACWFLVVVVLLVVRPGPWSFEGRYLQAALAAWLGAFAVVYLFQCRVQGLGVAIAILVGLCFVPLPVPESPIEAAWLLNETMLFAALGLLMLLWSEVHEPRIDPQFWLMLLIAASAVHAAVWLEAEQTPRLILAPSEDESAALRRLRQWALAFLVVGGCIGVVLGRRKANRIAAALVTLAAPGIGFGVAWMRAKVTAPMLFGGANWAGFLNEGEWIDAGWAWTSPTILLGVMAFAGYRLWSRGRKMRAKGEPALPWLLGLFSVLTLVVLLAGPRPATTPLPVVVLTVWLPVFVAVDLLILTGERLVRNPPEPGPSHIKPVR